MVKQTKTALDLLKEQAGKLCEAIWVLEATLKAENDPDLAKLEKELNAKPPPDNLVQLESEERKRDIEWRKKRYAGQVVRQRPGVKVRNQW
jgi:hypothetical protein